MSFRSFTQSMISITAISCFFIASAFAAGPIPRTDLRLELMVNGSTSDTSGNNRVTSYTGTSPTVLTDPTYGIKNWNFGGNGTVRVNTSWAASTTTDFTMSFWVKIPPENLVLNTSNNFTTLSGYTFPGGWQYFKYDKLMVIFSTKTSFNDYTGLRMAVSGDGQCSINGPRYDSGWSGLYAPGGYQVMNYGDFYTYQINQFQCQIKDGKWHNIVLVRRGNSLRTFIDGKVVNTISSIESFGKVISLGGYSFGLSNYYYTYYPQSVKSSIYSAHFLKGGISAIRLYSNALSEDDITALSEEYKFAQSQVVSTGSVTLSINNYVVPSLSIKVNNVPTNLYKNLVQYEFSVNSGSYSPVQSVTDSLSGSVMNYNLSINLSSFPDGVLNLGLRARSGSVNQNLGTVSFTKLDSNVSININSPNSNLANEKYITAQTSAGGVLSHSLTMGSICDNTLQFEDYSDLTFTNPADNGIRVCYRATFPNLGNKTIYKLSLPIYGIQQRISLVNQNSTKLFDNYTLWTKSSYPKPNDSTSLMLDLLGVSAASTQGTINGVTMTDINGDGLVDFLYSRNDPVRRSIIVNNGDYSFKVVYKCAVDSSSTGTTYFGDCADFLR